MRDYEDMAENFEQAMIEGNCDQAQAVLSDAEERGYNTESWKTEHNFDAVCKDFSKGNHS